MSDPAQNPVASAANPASGTPVPVRVYILALSALAGLALLGGLVSMALLWPRDPRGALLGALFIALVGFAFLLERRALVLHFGGMRTVSSFDEPVVFLALALLPPLALVPLVACSMTLVQVSARRAAIKSLFNIGAYTTAAALAATASGALVAFAGWSALAAATAGLGVYTVSSNALVAALFARLESRAFGSVFRERFLMASAWHIVLGVALGVGIIALWHYHPLATLIVAPLVLMTIGFMRLSARAEREVAAHRKLADIGAQLAGTRDVGAVATRVLETCGDLFVAGRARIELQRPDEPLRAWSREYEGGVAPGKPPLEAAIRGKEGRLLGRIVIDPARRVTDASRDVDPQLLQVVAGQAAAAIENAWALDEIAAMKDLQQGIVENVPAGVARLDAEGGVAQLNSTLRLTLGEGRPIPDGLRLEAVPRVAGDPGLVAALQGLREGRPFANHASELGGRRYLVAGVPLGAGKGAVVLFHDVTGRQEAQEALQTQGVTRPLVRRLILNLVGNVNATRFAIADMGRSLAGEIEGESLDAYTAAFRAMGLGRLQFERSEGEAYRFVGDDLLERRGASLQPTCHMALGFLEGVVGKRHGGKALGSEVRCQSQGHERCVFVVKPREA